MCLFQTLFAGLKCYSETCSACGSVSGTDLDIIKHTKLVLTHGRANASKVDAWWWNVSLCCDYPSWLLLKIDLTIIMHLWLELCVADVHTHTHPHMHTHTILSTSQKHVLSQLISQLILNQKWQSLPSRHLFHHQPPPLLLSHPKIPGCWTPQSPL